MAVTATLANSKLVVSGAKTSITIPNTNKAATKEQYMTAGEAIGSLGAETTESIYRVNESTLVQA